MPTHHPLPTNFTLNKAQSLALLLGAELLGGLGKTELKTGNRALRCQAPFVPAMLCDLGEVPSLSGPLKVHPSLRDRDNRLRWGEKATS